MWKLTKACVIIRIQGRSAERFLNALRRDGIALGQITRLSPDELRLSMRARDFRRIRRHAVRLHYRVHIETRKGTAFVFKRLLRRRTLWIGCALGLVLMMAASTRIWFIRVEGTSRVAEATVRRILSEQQLFCGAGRPADSFETIADRVAACDERIAWVGLDLDGVCLTVKIVEAAEEMLAIDQDQPCNVVAVKDGIITDISALAGEAMFAVGDMVRAGDVLIGGLILPDETVEPIRVHARGDVYARVMYYSEYAVSLVSEDRVATGAELPYRRISVCDHTLFESSPPYADYTIDIREERLLNSPLLPICMVSGSYMEMDLCPVRHTAPELAQTALVEAENGALLRVPLDARIVFKSADWQERDGVVIASCAIVTEENIGMTEEMND